ncbi:MAG: TlpA family protein disulfide reductase [Amphiplicatus sp.]
MKALKSARFWLVVWGALGAVLVLYVMIAASVKPREARGAGALHDTSLLVGEMADFEFAFPPRGAPAEPFDFEGGERRLADFRGKAILVNFWATWCAPCLKELPSLDALEGALGGEDFEVVAIAADPRGAKIAGEFLQRLGVENLKLYADPRLSLAAAVGGGGVLPVSILYDAAGREIGRLTGEADWSSPEARRLVERAIAGG